jgi:hypothetical protein
MNTVSPKITPFFWLNPLFLFYSGWKKPVPISEFERKIAKNDARWKKYAKVKRVLPQSSYIRGDYVGRIYSTWVFGYRYFIRG